jgi:hypothetical protein
VTAQHKSVVFISTMFFAGLFLGRAAVAGAQSAQPPNQKPASTTELKSDHQGLAIDAITLTIMIKSAIVALNQANQTGNYSVLRDLGTPVFRERYSQANLTDIFANLRNRGVNLAPAIILSPNLSKPPNLDDQGLLHLEGEFLTQPLQIQFKMIFRKIDAVWRIEGIAVDATQPMPGAIVSTGSEPKQPPQPSKTEPGQKAAAKPQKGGK